MGLSQRVSCPPAPWGPEKTPERDGPCYTHSRPPELPLPSTLHNVMHLGFVDCLFNTWLSGKRRLCLLCP